MRTLYHYPLCPFSRKMRLLLKEKDLPFELVTEAFWEKRPEFLALSPSGAVPVLVEEDGAVYSDVNAISEYLEEVYASPTFLGKDAKLRAEVRRMTGWFDSVFYADVSAIVLIEKLYKFLGRSGEPDSRQLHAADQRLPRHMAYLEDILKRRTWLAGDSCSLADFTAASHLSMLDYLANVPWNSYPAVKEWYALIKSRPSFRPLLLDRVPGFRPPAHYTDLDF